MCHRCHIKCYGEMTQIITALILFSKRKIYYIILYI